MRKLDGGGLRTNTAILPAVRRKAEVTDIDTLQLALERLGNHGVSDRAKKRFGGHGWTRHPCCGHLTCRRMHSLRVVVSGASVALVLRSGADDSVLLTNYVGRRLGTLFLHNGTSPYAENSIAFVVLNYLPSRAHILDYSEHTLRPADHRHHKLSVPLHKEN